MVRDVAMLCLVTDRRRLLVGEADFAAVRAALERAAREAVAAAVDLIQVREPGLETAQLVELVAAIVAIARGSTTRVVVNDRVDVALAAGADGVHLRADSVAPREVRTMTPGRFLVGRSVHHVDEAREHAPAVDYLIAGTVFPTASKAGGQAWLGAGGLGDIVRAVRVPVLAIGGMSVERAGEIAATGAAGLAAIGLFLPAGGPMTVTVDAVRLQFDTVRGAS